MQNSNLTTDHDRQIAGPILQATAHADCIISVNSAGYGQSAVDFERL